MGHITGLGKNSFIIENYFSFTNGYNRHSVLKQKHEFTNVDQKQN